MNYNAGKYDVCVIGAGHAGIEAALAAARLGVSVVCFTINMDTVGNMPCNPSIGGSAKGVLVREIDALGGEMARAADETCIQFRMLNRGKGPAVQSPRAQADKRAYQDRMKRVMENQAGLDLKQAEIVDINTENGEVRSVVTDLGAEYFVKAVIIASGTFLSSRIIIGEFSKESGPDGLYPAKALTQSLLNLGVELRRFKTGTPPRVNANSVNFSSMEVQSGERDLAPFSFETPELPENRADCFLTYTNADTHRIIRENLHRSPMYSGDIKGIGARYCPSIEDKIVKFADKSRHQIFVEPMGLGTAEVYLQGISSSMPEEVQLDIVHSVKGLENAKIMRPAYAIEYECVNPLEMHPSLELKKISGLYGAGQFCGTSGYEEAAALGLVAGINSALKILKKHQIVIDRSQAYIGILIDDLVTKGTNEPYRMMTSRSEYRLILRQDNADIRLCHIGNRVGLVSDERLARVNSKYETVKQEIERTKTVTVKPSDEFNSMLVEAGTSPISTAMRLYEVLKRPQIDYVMTHQYDPTRPELTRDIIEQIDITIKYEGYLKRQQAQVSEFKRQENSLIPENIDYTTIKGLRIEAKQKLEAVRPRSIGQAGRISGVNPADIAVLLIWIEKLRAEEARREA